MLLSTLLRTIKFTVCEGSVEKEITSVSFDSRTVSSGSLFIAKKGESVDGHSFIADALQRGATGIIAENFSDYHLQQAQLAGVTLIQVEDSIHEGGIVVAAYFGFPRCRLITIGVTGTDGKTTTSNLIYHLLKSLNVKVGLISTISARYFDGKNDIENDTGFHVTTPDGVEVQKYLRAMVDAGCTHAVIESTSHAFVQERLAGINFDVGVVTNITHEHLDYHKTMDRYVLAKAMLFRRDSCVPHKATALQSAVLNIDDSSWGYLAPYVSQWKKVSYGEHDFADFNIESVTSTLSGSSFVLQREHGDGTIAQSYTVTIPLHGTYNVYNTVAAVATVTELGFSVPEVLTHLATFPQLPGRFEVVSPQSQHHGTIVVDFAHTPKALESVLTEARYLTQGRLIVVFGSAGLRDVEKRFLMGQIAGRKSDISIITAEDPRTERVEDISSRILEGFLDIGGEEFPFSSVSDLSSAQARLDLAEHFPMAIQIPDRETAILTAIALSEPGDMVLICGKGHEKSMCFGVTEVPWSDQDVSLKAARKVG